MKKQRFELIAGELSELFRTEVQRLLASGVNKERRKRYVGLAQYPYLGLQDRLDCCYTLTRSTHELATNPDTPPKILKKLAEHFSWHWEIEAALENNPNSSVELLEKLKFDRDDSTRIAIADNPDSHQKMLGRLAEDRNEAIREAVARNANCPVAVLKKLANDKDSYVRRAVAKNPKCSSTTLRQLARDKHYWTRSAAAENANCPVAELKKLANDKNEEVRSAVAKNPNCPLAVLRKLAKDTDVWTREQAAAHPKWPDTELKRMAEDEDDGVRMGVATNPNTAPRILRDLAVDSNSDVIQSAAANPNCPVASLRRLVGSKDNRMRHSVASNPRCPATLLKELATDTNKEIRLTVTDNPRCPPSLRRKLLERLVIDGNEKIRLRIAEQPGCPPAVLKLLAADKKASVRKAVAKRSDSPIVVPQKPAKSVAVHVRAAVGRNALNLADSVDTLDSSPSWDVVRNALANPKCPKTTRTETIQSIVTNGDWAKRIGLASAWGAKWLSDPHIVETLARDSDWRVRKAVASNPSIPISTYKALLAGEHEKVRLAASLNVLHPFNDKMIRTQFAASPWMQVQLEKAEPKFPGITVAVKNGDYLFPAPKTSKAIRSQSLLGRIIALSQPDTPPSELARASGYRDWRQRMAIARNLVTPADTLNKLRQDSNEHVAAQASVTLRKKGRLKP